MNFFELFATERDAEKCRFPIESQEIYNFNVGDKNEKLFTYRRHIRRIRQQSKTIRFVFVEFLNFRY